MEITVGLVMLAAVIGLFVVGFAESPREIDYSPPPHTTPTTPDPRFAAGVLQAQATENSGMRSRQVAVIVAAGAAFSLYLTFLNLARESRRDAHEREVKESERATRQVQIANERFSRAIEHLKPENSTAVRTAGIKALEMLANEPHGPREEVRAVLVELGNEQPLSPSAPPADGDAVPADIRAAREAGERLRPRFHLVWDEESRPCVQVAEAIETALSRWFPSLEVAGPVWLAGQGIAMPDESSFIESRAAGVVIAYDKVFGVEGAMMALKRRATAVLVTALRQNPSAARSVVRRVALSAASTANAEIPRRAVLDELGDVLYSIATQEI
jgi:cellobiose-specific phosphotransferase system component IIA